MIYLIYLFLGIVVLIFIFIFSKIFFKKIKLDFWRRIIGFFYRENTSSSILAKKVLEQGSFKNLKESSKNNRDINKSNQDKKELVSIENIDNKPKQQLKTKRKLSEKQNQGKNPEINPVLSDIENNLKEPNKKEPSNKEKIELIISRIKDPDIIKLLEYIKDKNFDISNLYFSSDSNVLLEETLKNHFINILKNRYENLKNDLSILRKKGKDVSSISLTIMSVPLKIKIFSSSLDRTDFDKCWNILETIKSELDKINIEESKKSIEDIKNKDQ
jgi:hypothetical protein